MKMTEEEVNNIQELFENEYNNNKLSSMDIGYLNERGLVIYNNWSTLELIEMGVNEDDKILVSIPYYTVWNATKSEWDKVDKDFKALIS